MRALIINNIGTPDDFDSEAVGDYLNEFLMDPDIISIPYPLRWLLVKRIIVPRRKSSSSSKYRKVWTEEGSPLLMWTRRFIESLKRELDTSWTIQVGMRYGNPGTRLALERAREAGATEIYFAPMYPQWARATTGSAIAEVIRQMKKMGWTAPLKVLRPFYRDEKFLDSVASRIGDKVRPNDVVLFSYHGLPESQVKKTPGCLRSGSCCDRAESGNFLCYRAHCLWTTRYLVHRLGLDESRWRLSFQSRLGSSKWLGPATDDVLRELGGEGKSVVVACPSFVADCLETLEEIGMDGRRDYLAAGGSRFEMVDCPNSDEGWIKNFAGIVVDDRSWTEAQRLLSGG